ARKSFRREPPNHSLPRRNPTAKAANPTPSTIPPAGRLLGPPRGRPPLGRRDLQGRAPRRAPQGLLRLQHPHVAGSTFSANSLGRLAGRRERKSRSSLPGWEPTASPFQKHAGGEVGSGDRGVLLCLQGRGETRTAGEEPKKEEEGAGGPNTDLSVEFGKSTGTHAKVASPPSTTKRTRTRRLPPSRRSGGFWDHPEDGHRPGDATFKGARHVRRGPRGRAVRAPGPRGRVLQGAPGPGARRAAPGRRAPQEPERWVATPILCSYTHTLQLLNSERWAAAPCPAPSRQRRQRSSCQVLAALSV
ncbi:Zinc finger CCCH domain-containing protein 46, partial [Zea mays]